MLDIKFIRENKDIIKEGARKKHIDLDLDTLLLLDDERLELLKEVELKRQEHNKQTDEISETSDEKERTRLIIAVKAMKEGLQKKETILKEIMAKWQRLMVEVPNIPDMSVPEGKTDAENREERVWGEVPKFSFSAKGHIEIMKKIDMVDFERGAKVAGFRGYFLKNAGVTLSFALWQYVLDEMMKKSFTPLMVPSLVTRAPFIGTGYLPQSENDLYKTGDNMYFSGTGEVATMAYYMDEVLSENDLPKKFVAFSPCFRSEAGSHGKDTKGLIRVHEFFKLEQVILCEANHQTSVSFHEELTKNAEEIIQALKLPYRVVINCGGDLGLGQVKKYDIEVWMPSENKYRESHSSSYFHDFQTRRLNIRYKDNAGKLRFVHSLNNTAIASPRILTSIVENYQQADGSVAVPEVLQKYLGGEVINKTDENTKSFQNDIKQTSVSD